LPYWAIFSIIFKMDEITKAGRPKCIRKVEKPPDFNYFKPRGIPLTDLESVKLTVEEVEAIRLRHYDKLKRIEAANNMGISRRTMERELSSGLEKIIDALLNGKAIEIRGGYYVSNGETMFRCLNDKYEWKVDKSLSKPKKCPECGSKKIKRKKR